MSPFSWSRGNGFPLSVGGRPRADSPRPKTVVIHETLANLSRLPAKLIEMIDAFCKDPQAHLAVTSGDTGSAGGSTGSDPIEMGPCYGVVGGLHSLARELGIVSAVAVGGHRAAAA